MQKVKKVKIVKRDINYKSTALDGMSAMEFLRILNKIVEKEDYYDLKGQDARNSAVQKALEKATQKTPKYEDYLYYTDIQ